MLKSLIVLGCSAIYSGVLLRLIHGISHLMVEIINEPENNKGKRCLQPGGCFVVVGNDDIKMKGFAKELLFTQLQGGK